MEKWIKVETNVDDLYEQYDIIKIIGYEDGFLYVELNDQDKDDGSRD
jgi:hypothetical protein